MRLKHKFGAKPVVIDKKWFGSTKEGKRYTELKLLQRSGEVLFFLRQVAFPLLEDTKAKTVPNYKCDFVVFWADGNVTIEDVKGYRTPEYKKNKKLVESIYPFCITEI